MIIISENIFSEFKNELGYINTTNQYVELSIRISNVDIKNELTVLSKNYNLNISALNEDYMVRISKSYIVNINTCLENFLKTFKCLPGSPTNISKYNKQLSEGYLEWTIKTANLNIDAKTKNDINICEYYRLIRNLIVHNGNYSSTEKSKLSLIINNNEKLHAPNDINTLNFDDQVLFSRAAFNVAKFIFNNSQYDIDTIVESNRLELFKLISPFREVNARPRAAKKIKNFIKQSYPDFLNVNWEQIVNKIIG